MRVLFFTTDFSLENQAFAKKHGFLLRDSRAYSTIDYLEKCDAVYGDVPNAYKNLPVYELNEEPKAKENTKTESKSRGKKANEVSES